MQNQPKINIYSLRYSPAQGNHWRHERECLAVDIQEWLAVFRGDEPGVTFIGSVRRPARP